MWGPPLTKNFQENISKELDNLSRKLEAISTRVDSLDAAIDDLLKYSFQYNVKIIGFPEQDEHESSETTTQLCLKLFHAIGAEGVTKNDIDIAHRVNSRRADRHYPRPIVCKFIRRLAKEEVMAHRNETSNLNPWWSGFICWFSHGKYPNSWAPDPEITATS